MTNVWAPVRINGPHVRCTSCDQMSDTTKNEGECNCGEILPEVPLTDRQISYLTP
jgi:hypothetical protein